MISYVDQEAATDRELNELALRMLIFLGGQNPHIGGWSHSTYREMAKIFRVSPREIKSAQHQLLLHGFLTRKIGTVTHAYPTRTRKERHFFYSTAV